MHTKKTLLILAIITLSVGGACLHAQQLSSLFERLRSSDQAVRSQAQQDALPEFEKVLPRIQDEVPALKTAFFDPAVQVRLEATAMLSFLAYTPLNGDKYGAVLEACLPDLMIVAEEKDADVADRALRAIATMPHGPPESAFPLLERALDSPDKERVGLGVLGLTMSPKTNPQIAAEITGRLRSAKDSGTKLALLSGLAPSGSDAVADATAALLYDPDSEVRNMATLGVPHVYKDKQKAKAKLEEFRDSSKLTPDLKLKLVAAIAQTKALAGGPTVTH